MKRMTVFEITHRAYMEFVRERLMNGYNEHPEGRYILENVIRYLRGEFTDSSVNFIFGE